MDDLTQAQMVRRTQLENKRSGGLRNAGGPLTKAEEDELKMLGGDPEALRVQGEKPPTK